MNTAPGAPAPIPASARPPLPAPGLPAARVALSVLLTAAWSPARGQSPGFVLGADVSYLTRVEAGGAWFEDGQGRRDPLQILADHGFTLFRLRQWHTPAGGYHGLAYNLALAQRIRDVGGDILLDFHYSDTWADPGHQAKPAAWVALPFDLLADSLQAYTERVLRAFDAAGALPVAVQIGNETTQGMLFPDGLVGGASDTPAQWAKLRTLFDRGIAGVRAVEPAGTRISIILHVDRGGDYDGARWFFDGVGSSVDYDWIGLSYYPWWHGTFTAFERTVRLLSGRYSKPILVAETAYPWSTLWYDGTTNLVGPSASLLPQVPASPEGQRAFLRAVSATLKSDPRGAGWVYWAPDYVATPGFGSVWENVALFDDRWRWMHEATLTTRERSGGGSTTGYAVHPNPASTWIRSPCTGELFDLLGRRLARVAAAEVDVGPLPAGPYMVRCAVSDGAPRAIRFAVAR